MKTALSLTVLNEEATIDWLLRWLSWQVVEPDEIIIVDGGSTDSTVKKIKRWQKKSPFGKKIKLFQQKGNRSVGRNLAVSKTHADLIAFTDAGCIPLTKWLEELLKTQRETNAEVVAGYYIGLWKTGLQEAMIPYVLVMPDKVNPKNFLPAARSMLINKKTFQELGGFDESLSHNEDFAFAKKLEKAEIKRAFAPDAVVGWLPRKNFTEFARMIYRFALGDIEAGIIRPKIILIFARYLIFFGLLAWVLILGQLDRTNNFFPLIILLYLLLSIEKNKRYTPHGWFYLPFLQIVSDWAVMAGSLTGTYSLIKRTKSST